MADHRQRQLGIHSIRGHLGRLLLAVLLTAVLAVPAQAEPKVIRNTDRLQSYAEYMFRMRRWAGIMNTVNRKDPSLQLTAICYERFAEEHRRYAATLPFLPEWSEELAAQAAAEAAQAEQQAWETNPYPPEGWQITWIGDSYSVMAEGIIQSWYPGTDLYAAYSKHTEMNAEEGYGGDSGITILYDIVSQGLLRDYLVFALGTNDPIPSTEVYASYIDTVMALAGEDTIVIFVTPWTKNASWGEVDYQCEIDAMRNAAYWYPNARVADWAEFCQPYIDEFFSYDSIHPVGPGGIESWVGLIANELDR